MPQSLLPGSRPSRSKVGSGHRHLEKAIQGSLRDMHPGLPWRAPEVYTVFTNTFCLDSPERVAAAYHPKVLSKTKWVLADSQAEGQGGRMKAADPQAWCPSLQRLTLHRALSHQLPSFCYSSPSRLSSRPLSCSLGCGRAPSPWPAPSHLSRRD